VKDKDYQKYSIAFKKTHVNILTESESIQR